MNLRSLVSQARRILIMGHQNADPDAVCAMAAMKSLISSINSDVEIEMVADDVSRLSIQVMGVLAPEERISEDVKGDHDLLVLLDTNSRYQLGDRFQEVPQNPEYTIVIDHHEPNPDIDQLSLHTLVRSDRYSTCEIIADMFDENEIKMSSGIASLLLTGLLFDTRRFFYSDTITLRTALALLERGANYDDCVRSLIIQPDRSERIARLTAAGRLKIHNVGNWVVVTSKVRAFEASACRALIDVGADVAIVGGRPDKNQVRLSSRSTREFSRETRVNLGADVMEPLGPLIGGKGGGHANAAGANGVENLEEALTRAVDLIRMAVEREAGKNTGDT